MRCSSDERLRNKTPKITPISIIRAKSRPPCFIRMKNSSTEPPIIATSSKPNLPAGGNCE